MNFGKESIEAADETVSLLGTPPEADGISELRSGGPGGFSTRRPAAAQRASSH